MTQEDKNLLLIDLSARLPYRLKVDASRWTDNKPRTLVEICPFLNEELKLTELAGYMSVCYCKPYLRPMSSMTEEEMEELLNIDTGRLISSRHLTWHLDGEVVDYFNSHHFDHRGLIEKGLALEAPKGMYNI